MGSAAGSSGAQGLAGADGVYLSGRSIESMRESIAVSLDSIDENWADIWDDIWERNAMMPCWARGGSVGVGRGEGGDARSSPHPSVVALGCFNGRVEEGSMEGFKWLVLTTSMRSSREFSGGPTEISVRGSESPRMALVGGSVRT